MLAIGEHITSVVDCVSNLVVCSSLNRYQTTLLMNDRGELVNSLLQRAEVSGAETQQEWLFGDRMTGM